MMVATLGFLTEKEAEVTVTVEGLKDSVGQGKEGGGFVGPCRRDPSGLQAGILQLPALFLQVLDCARDQPRGLSFPVSRYKREKRALGKRNVLLGSSSFFPPFLWLLLVTF